MDETDLRRLLFDLESDRVERKASASDKRKIHQAICAFANDMPDHGLPGVLFIGVHDDGQCANLEITDQLLLLLANCRDDGTILPIPTMTVQKHVIDKCELAVVIVEPALAPPVRYKGQVWIRVGPRRALASIEEERRLADRRRARDLPFDLRPVRTSGLSDLDINHFQTVYLPSALHRDLLVRNNRSIREQLVSLRFAQYLDPGGAGGAVIIPTVVGLLVTGSDPRAFIPGAYIQFLFIDGVSLTDPIKDQKALFGPINDMLRMADELMTLSIGVRTEVAGRDRERQRPEYPIEALKQLVRNAVLHRNYEQTNAPVRVYWFRDRIEIHSPGGPFGQVNADNFGQPGITDYRNPHLAEAMRNLGYIQKFGIGIQIAKHECTLNHNPEPEFSVRATTVLATVRNAL